MEWYKAETIKQSIVVMFTLLISGFSVSSTAYPKLEVDHWLFQTSLYTKHFDSDPEHTESQNLISAEARNPDEWLAGAAWFKNSFDQPSWYFYGGRRFSLWEPSDSVEVHAKLTAGLLRGYDGDKKDKIPFNDLGVAPAVLPSIGARLGPVETDLLLFGNAGLMVTAGLRF
ncbi:hypothetical protein [Aidingimonas halophila]|uniref:Sn-glycerol-3-phosphate transporter n=1 Tax=Aidingimonas halophila TaxID=574349 RepID=A0A1H2Z1E0_9GAMM|nr:hypothetical protein [Aidingimonas halophila]GHC15196.1 hypothetical protein GCM10008094_00100 [Aidingimonas halophila]SDX11151.1 hypothetical protein SAMN05443545_10410 [Aidingimonas halophila]